MVLILAVAETVGAGAMSVTELELTAWLTSDDRLRLAAMAPALVVEATVTSAVM